MAASQVYSFELRQFRLSTAKARAKAVRDSIH
jgi:hypothetical protein